MVDGLRGSLIDAVVGVEIVNPPLIDLVVVIIICIFVLGAGSVLFSRSEI